MDPEETKSNLLIPGSIIVAGVIIAFSVVYVSGPRPLVTTPPPPPSGSTPPPARQAVGADVLVRATSAVLGNPNAPVTVVEFSDFQCPFCGRFHATVEPKIISDYVRTGKVKFVYRDFPFLDGFPGVSADQKESHWASEAARCAGAEGKFWEYHDYLFQHQNGENQGAFAKDKLKAFASALKLDTAAFNSCLDSDKYANEIEQDKSDASTAGVSATPTTFVNGVMVTVGGQSAGAAPYATFKTAIDAALAKKK